MSIGIEDADFNQYVLVCFNLEAMKLSAYYKKHNELVVLAPGFYPERHTKFFYRKDYDDGIYPLNLLTTPNVSYGGLAFSSNRYQPLPLDIEICHPDTSLYSRAESIIMNTTSPSRKKIYQNLTEAEHCRLSLDGQTIWPQYEKQFYYLPTCRNLIIHDFDLGTVKDSFEVVKDILGRARTDGWATKVGMKFPIQIYDGQQLLNWASLNGNSTFYSVQYNGVIDDDAFMEWVGRNRTRTVYTQMDYVVTNPKYTEEEFTSRLINQIFRQIIISRAFRVFFKIKYDENFFTDKRWCEVLRLFNFYMNSLSGAPTSRYLQANYEDTLFKFARNMTDENLHYPDMMTKTEAREVFKFVRDHNESLFNDFYECSSKTLGGKI